MVVVFQQLLFFEEAQTPLTWCITHKDSPRSKKQLIPLSYLGSIRQELNEIQMFINPQFPKSFEGYQNFIYSKHQRQEFLQFMVAQNFLFGCKIVAYSEHL